ncbi:dTDP-4-dehydrorhamnose 3,5-epimerase [Granulosicoccus antarcticus]|uniref:dTDP-4-dehydrorhamnose 3,5-epimerase n=1 Tax=Granulosicoccus antarcticus IMCC3135 TaxID=1192854 RepID=A0A2Z2P1Z2_9GAMM|nr:dTDP-4-dehydrorhamnose 3,5-epimerase [Granulosicoccus antarcticus]ASJ75310.1 dTDP-4-dehydrorhamnose 3,5-epimerase [Granulosicoccus antarcticus IMCC3135]
MQFIATKLDGAWIVELDRLEDERGFFARSFCQRELDKMGMNSSVVQSNLSFNVSKGTLRGMHYQVAPAEETKLVRCTRGSIVDVIVDMRPDSPTYREHIAVELSAENHRSLFVPANFAHGFQTLEDNTEIMYMVSGFYTPDCERGLRFNDPSLNIQWPLPVDQVSDKDAQWPLL